MRQLPWQSAKPNTKRAAVTRKRSLFAGSSQAAQGRQTRLEAAAITGDEGAVADLALPPGRLAVVVVMGPGHRALGLARPQMTREIDHHRIPERLRGAGRPAEHGAQVILELARDRSLDRPVPGIMHARRHLVGNEASARREELDREHAPIV